MTFLCDPMQRRPFVFTLDLGSVFHEASHYIAMAFKRGFMQRRPAVFISGVYVGSVFHQRTH